MAVIPGPRTRATFYDAPPGSYPYTVVDDQGKIKYFNMPQFSTFSRSEIMDDVVTENFRERSSRGEIINNPMSKVKTEKTWVIPYFERIAPNNWRDFGYEKTFQETGVLPSPDYSNMISDAVTRSYAKVDSSSAALLVTLGELRETKQMLVDSIKSLVNFRTILAKYRDLLKRTINKYGERRFTSTQAASEALDMWMQVRFGWLPFVSDVQSLYKAITGLKSFEERQTFRAGAKETFRSDDTTAMEVAGSHIATFARTSVVDVNVSAGVLCNQRYGGIPDTYGITKIPGVIWELTRLSWAVDYFFNVADVIASFTPDSLWNPLTSWVTIREHKTDTVRLTGAYTNSSNFTSVSLASGVFVQDTYSVKRTPCVQRGGIIFRPKLNWARYIDLVGVVKPSVVKTIRETIKLYTRFKGR